MSSKGVGNCFAISRWFRFAIQVEQGWRHALNGYCDHCSWKLNNWSQCRSSLRCCNQSVHVYQNCLEQSQKHVCNGAYDHHNHMETRLKPQSLIFLLLTVSAQQREEPACGWIRPTPHPPPSGLFRVKCLDNILF